jgi:hypothetical protein
LGDKELIRELRESLGRLTVALVKKEDPTIIPGEAADWALKRIEENKEKIRLAEEFGMKFGILKSSDCPEGKMAFTVKKDSELWRLELEIAENIEARIAVDDFLDHLRVIKELKRSFVMSDSPWPLHNGEGYVLPKHVIDNLEPLLESLGESTPHAMGRGLGAAIVAWLKKTAKEKGTTVQAEAEKMFGKKEERIPGPGDQCPKCLRGAVMKVDGRPPHYSDYLTCPECDAKWKDEPVPSDSATQPNINYVNEINPEDLETAKPAGEILRDKAVRGIADADAEAAFPGEAGEGAQEEIEGN